MHGWMQRKVSGFCLRILYSACTVYKIYMAQLPDIFRCICSYRYRRFDAEVPIIIEIAPDSGLIAGSLFLMSVFLV